MKPDRVVVGVDSPDAAQVIGELYASFVRTGNPIIFMDIPSAEMTSMPPTRCWRRASRS